MIGFVLALKQLTQQQRRMNEKLLAFLINRSYFSFAPEGVCMYGMYVFACVLTVTVCFV